MKKQFTLIAMLFIFGGQLLAQNWGYATSTGTSFILFGMSFPSGQNDIGYACGMETTYNADGVITKTTDGGDNWTTIFPTSGAINGLQGIWFTSTTVGFAGGWNDYFVKTTDGGTNWTQINAGAGVWYYKDVEFWDANNGVAVASMNDYTDQSVFITSDGGNTWVPCTSGMDNASIMGLSYADANTIFAVGTDSQVHKSTDGGWTWTSVTNLGALLFGVDFANSTFGVVGGEEKMFATNDGGSTWTTYNTGYENFYGAQAFSNGTGYIGGTDENIYITTDYGASWSMEFNGAGTSSIYRIRATDNGNLYASASQGTIMIYEPPFGADFIASNDSVCEGNTIDFTDLSTGSIISWDWTFEGGTPATSTDQNPTVTYNTTGNYDVTLEVSDGTNTNTLTQPDLIHVIVTSGSPATPTGATTVCGGDTEAYTTLSIAGATSYFWEVDPASAGTITGTDTIGTFNADDSWTGTYTIKVRANNFCGWGAWSNTLNGTLSFNPYAFNISDGGGYCSGGDGIEVTLSGSETDVDYELYLDGVTTGSIIAGTGSPISFGFQTQSGVYSIIGFSSSCSEPMVGESYIYLDFVPEMASTPSGPDAVCQGNSTDYSTEPLFASDTLYWVLTPPESGIITGGDENISIDWDTDFSGMANLTVQGNNYCGYGPESDPLEITVSNAPEPVVTGLTLVCNDEEADYSTQENPGSSYEWTVVGGDIVSGSGTFMISVLWGDPGNGTVEVAETIGNDCRGDSEQLEVTIDDCIGIDENLSPELTIYPNPVQNILNINLMMNNSEEYTLVVQNMLGQTVSLLEGTGTGQEEIINLNTDKIPEGQYIISINTTNGQLNHKSFIKIK